MSSNKTCEYTGFMGMSNFGNSFSTEKLGD